ncbi:MAG TPA: hypothetical protein VGP82_18295 [Ktedonobacterales bacterium]|jgi:hypothetical protein|nr:hypothetical protein [Ktedonobacterales bacterium]
MSEPPVKLMLLGIALLLFGLAFPTTLLPLLEYWIAPFSRTPPVTQAILTSLFPVAGLVVACFGFFTGRRQPA